jgi:hypothetical protein
MKLTYIVTNTITGELEGRFSVEGTTVRVRSDTFPEGLKGHLESLLVSGGEAALQRYMNGPSPYQAGLKFTVQDG